MWPWRSNQWAIVSHKQGTAAIWNTSFFSWRWRVEEKPRIFFTNYSLSVENLESLAFIHASIFKIWVNLKGMAYVGEKLPKNKIFMQYHTDYPGNIMQIIVQELCSLRPKVKLVLATVQPCTVHGTKCTTN